MIKTKLFGTIAVILMCSLSMMAQTVKQLTVQADQPKATIASTMWGVFFEDINMGADGGIYAELIKNRSFEFSKPFMGWKIEQKQFQEGAITVLNRQEKQSANPRFLHVNVDKKEKGDLGITNEGFRGMGIKKGLRYDFSLMYQLKKEGIQLHLELLNSKKEVIGSTVMTPTAGKGWMKQQISFNSTDSAMKGQFRLWFTGSGTIDLDMISLFPEDTWKKRPGGMRADMIQMLADMKPGFVRFPGGCIVEGIDLNNRYQWKKTLGPIEERQLIMNRWNVEFAHRPTPDYFQTFGLGFFEYFQLCDDIGAEPLPILNCGMACQFNTAELVSLDQLGPYVQDALDLIEFANGDTTTKWGSKRAAMGHPAPFHLKMMGVGNENWGPQYLERLAIFQKAINAKYPDFKLVTSSGTDPDGDRFDLLNNALRKMNVAFIDEHYYRRPEWFFANARRYDNYPRNNVKIFAGEYAAQSDRTVSEKNRNNWITALSEAAFLTGLERNADVVQMASYAPLFAHAEGWQWTPDLIWTDNLRVYGTPDYYVQQMYSLNKGNVVVPITMHQQTLAGEDSLYATASIDTLTKEVIIKVVNAGVKAQSLDVFVNGVKKLDPKGIQIFLGNDRLDVVNSLENPKLIAPIQQPITVKGKTVSLQSKGYSFNILRVKILK